MRETRGGGQEGGHGVLWGFWLQSRAACTLRVFYGLLVALRPCPLPTPQGVLNWVSEPKPGVEPPKFEARWGTAAGGWAGIGYGA